MVSKATNLVCDNSVLQKHIMYDKYHSPLHIISQKDYPNDTYFQSRPDIEGVDLDQYEIDHAIDDRDMTMDVMVGVADYSQNRLVNNRLLLLELRMDYDSTKHLRHKKLLGKINHTRAAIGSDVRVDEENVFVFRKDVAEVAERWMSNIAKEYPDAKTWTAMSPNKLENLLQSQASMPYQPETDMSVADVDMANKIKDKDFEGLLDFISFWNTKAEEFSRQYKLREEEHIKIHLHDVWQQTKIAGYTLTKEQQAYAEVIEEEYPYLIA